MADDTKQMLRLDRDMIQAFGGDVNNAQLREEYFAFQEKWRRAGQGRASVDRCFDWAAKYPNPKADAPRYVENAGAGPSPGAEPTPVAPKKKELAKA